MAEAAAQTWNAVGSTRMEIYANSIPGFFLCETPYRTCPELCGTFVDTFPSSSLQSTRENDGKIDGAKAYHKLRHFCALCFGASICSARCQVCATCACLCVVFCVKKCCFKACIHVHARQINLCMYACTCVCTCVRINMCKWLSTCRVYVKCMYLH